MSDSVRATPAGERVVLVTAGAAGLGKGVVRALSADGYRVAFTYRAEGTGPDGTLEAVRSAGNDAFGIDANFVHRGAGAAAVERTLQQYGRVDILVHAVGPMIVRRFERATLADYELLMQTNFGSAVECSIAALPGMRERGFGRLVFFGMHRSHATLPSRGMALYGAAKAAVVAFARTLALEEARHGITVNVVEPGDIPDKEIGRAEARSVAGNNPTRHAGSWEDVADAVRFLVRDDAGFINGVTLAVDGGMAEPRR